MLPMWEKRIQYDINNRRGIINIFLRAIYLFDDRLTLILNGGDKVIVIDDILLDDIEASNEEYLSSSLVADAPPSKNQDQTKTF